MNSFEELVLWHIKDNIPTSLLPYQFILFIGLKQIHKQIAEIWDWHFHHLRSQAEQWSPPGLCAQPLPVQTPTDILKNSGQSQTLSQKLD